jgi:hypothetical protein
VQRESEPLVIELGPELRDALGQRPFNGERQVAHPEIEQLFVAEFGPILS